MFVCYVNLFMVLSKLPVPGINGLLILLPLLVLLTANQITHFSYIVVGLTLHIFYCMLMTLYSQLLQMHFDVLLSLFSVQNLL